LNPEAAKVNDRGKKQVPEINNQPRVVKRASSSGTLISVKKELNRLYILGTLITWFASYPAKSSQILKNHSIMLFTSNANSL